MQGRCRGFSLFELLVVILIVGLTVSATTLSIRTEGPEDAIRLEALRFNQLVELLLEEAILRGEDFGIEFKPRSYRFVRFREGKWITIDNDKLLRPREMPQDIELDLAVEQTDIIIRESEDDAEASKPQVFVLSSGEITPEFSVAFFIPTNVTRYVVTGRFDGKHYAELED